MSEPRQRPSPLPRAPEGGADTPLDWLAVRAAAHRLHGHLASHSRDGVVVGPDSGVRFHRRIGRFGRSVVPGLSSRDAYCYLQAQGYWILANWSLSQEQGDRFERCARAASTEVVRRQHEDGSWPYPHPGWRGRIATAEGTWACLGLLETYRRTGDGSWLSPIRRWLEFVDGVIGYIDLDGACAVNYFAGVPSALVPNNAAFQARFLAELWALERADDALASRAAELVEFLARSQVESGELPYAVASPESSVAPTPHFQCFQYNAFQFLDVLRCCELTGDWRHREVLVRLLDFLRRGLMDDGHVRFDCHGPASTAVVYHAAVVAAALTEGTRHGLGDHAEAAQRAVRWVLSAQRDDGSMPFSVREHRVLRDRHAYPRNLAMILHHLLTVARS